MILNSREESDDRAVYSKDKPYPRPTIEESYQLIVNIVDRVECEFNEKFEKNIDLRNPEDVIRLAKLVNFRNEVFLSRPNPEAESDDPSVNPIQFHGYDIAQEFIARHLFRDQSIFPDLADDDRGKVIEAIRGKLFYNPPPRDYINRAQILEEQIAKGNEFKIQNFLIDFQDYITELYKFVYKGDNSAMERKRLIHESFTDSFANPLSYEPMWTDYDGKQRSLREIINYFREFSKLASGFFV